MWYSVYHCVLVPRLMVCGTWYMVVTRIFIEQTHFPEQQDRQQPLEQHGISTKTMLDTDNTKQKKRRTKLSKYAFKGRTIFH